MGWRSTMLASVFGLGVLAAGPALAQPAACPGQGLQYLLDAVNGRQFISSATYPPQPDWPLFMHPASAVITFYYPAGWQAVPLESAGAIGVLVRSPDGGSGLQIYATRPAGPVTARQAAELAVGGMLGQGSQPQLLCAQDLQIPGMIPQTVTFLAATDGRAVAAATAQVMHDPATGAPTWVDARSVVAPAQQFDTMLVRAFLPMIAQWQGGGGGGGGDDDDDDDGESGAEGG